MRKEDDLALRALERGLVEVTSPPQGKAVAPPVLQATMPAKATIPAKPMGKPATAKVSPVAVILLLRDQPLGVLPLRGPRMVLGRDPRCAIHLEHSKVSRQHAELLADAAGVWTLGDLGSRNHTLLNGREVQSPVRVYAGDRIAIEKFTLELTAQAAAGAAPDPAASVVELSPAEPEAISELNAATHLTAEQSAALYDLGRHLLAVESAGERRRLLCRLLVQPAFGGSAVTVLQVNREDPGSALHMLCPTETAAPGCGQSLYVSRGVLQALVKEQRPILASNVADRTPEALELSISAATTALTVIAAPLQVEAQSLEVLYVVLRPDGTAVDALALATLAVQTYQLAAAAWEARELAEANAELAPARQLQERLVPQGHRRGDTEFAIGFHPCAAVGGAYADAVALPDGKTLLVIADVGDKGMAAALVASRIHTIVHTGARRGASLVDLADDLNFYLRQTLPESHGATLLAVVLDPATGQIEYVNAGHPSGLIVGRDGRSRALGTVANLPLGTAQEPPSVAREVLAPGELLALLTAGLSEMAPETLGRCLRDLYRDAGTQALPEIAAQWQTALEQLLDGSAPDERTFLLARRAPAS